VHEDGDGDRPFSCAGEPTRGTIIKQQIAKTARTFGIIGISILDALSLTPFGRALTYLTHQIISIRR
jgi:hypothetical protein